MEKYRFLIFLSGFSLFAVLEFFFEFRQRNFSRLQRWPHHFLLILSSQLLLKIFLPFGLSLYCVSIRDQGFGLFSLMDLPVFLEVTFSLLIFDFAIYMQHWLFHSIPILWKIHRVHHSDIDLDVTSALRFHPLEIILSIAFKVLLITLIAPSVLSFVLFEIVLNFMAMFNHANIFIPNRFEKLIRYLLVTPQMHIVHHSVRVGESRNNYGFNFSFWDRIFKTYLDDFQFEKIIGDEKFRSREDQGLGSLIKQPFK